MTKWEELADDEAISKTIEALKKNGITAVVVENKEEAKKKVLELIPKGSELMTMTSQTLEAIGIPKILNESDDYEPIRKKFASMDQKKDGSMMRKLGAGPDFAIGSAHAVTEDGHVFIASATGSQLPAYAYGAGKVIWVVGTQKIVKDANEAMTRIHDYTFPLEDARARKAYGMGSGINKMLIVNKEVQPGRMTIVFVKEKLGF